MDHYEHPHNKRVPSDERYQKINMDSTSCIDNIDVFLLVEDGKVVDCCFDGVGCTISTASTSMMTDLVIGESIERARYIIEQYQNMIHEKEFDEEALGDTIVFANTYKQAARIRCATIGWRGLTHLLDDAEGKPHEEE